MSANIPADAEYIRLVRAGEMEAAHARYLELERGATTPGGYPYPDPTDPVAEGAAAIRALAEAVQARMVLSLNNTGALPIAAGATITIQYGFAYVKRGFTTVLPATSVAIPQTGAYRISASGSVAQAGGNYFNLTVAKNSVDQASATGTVYPHTNGYSAALVNVVLECVAGDAITVKATASSAGNVEPNSARLQLELIAPGAPA